MAIKTGAPPPRRCLRFTRCRVQQQNIGKLLIFTAGSGLVWVAGVNRCNFYNGRRNLGTGLPPLSTNFLGSSSGSLLQSYVLC